MNILQSELYHNPNGDRGEIMKTVSGQFLVRKYRDFCVMYYCKRFESYGQAKHRLTCDGFSKDRR